MQLDEETEEFENEKLLSGVDNKYTVVWYGFINLIEFLWWHILCNVQNFYYFQDFHFVK